jgi:hypothetical protein
MLCRLVLLDLLDRQPSHTSDRFNIHPFRAVNFGQPPTSTLFADLFATLFADLFAFLPDFGKSQTRIIPPEDT